MITEVQEVKSLEGIANRHQSKIKTVQGELVREIGDALEAIRRAAGRVSLFIGPRYGRDIIIVGDGVIRYHKRHTDNLQWRTIADVGDLPLRTYSPDWLISIAEHLVRGSQYIEIGN